MVNEVKEGDEVKVCHYPVSPRVGSGNGAIEITVAPFPLPIEKLTISTSVERAKSSLAIQRPYGAVIPVRYYICDSLINDLVVYRK